MNIRDQWLTLVEQVYFLGVSVSTLGSERELSAKCHRSSISRSMTPATAREAMNCQLAFEKISTDSIGAVGRDG